MKRSIMMVTMPVVIAGILCFAGCSSSSEKANNANKEVTEEAEDFEKDLKAYKEKMSKQIEANEKSIEAFNTRIADQKSVTKAMYEKKIAELERKNAEMKEKMAGFEADTKSDWESFKEEFSHDMEELGTAFKDFTVKNN